MHSPRLLKMMQDAKLNKYSLAEAKELATTFDENTNKIKQQFIEEHEKDFDGAAYKKLDDIKVEILKQWFREQLR